MVSELKVRELTPAIGAEIEGIDFTTALDIATSDQLRDLLAKYSVLRFRGQRLDEEHQIRALSYFAEVMPNPSGKLAAYVSNKEKDASVPFGRLPFHSDLFWTDHPLQVTSLYGVELEQPAESTTFASTLSAYAHLDDATKIELDGLIGLNINDASPFRKGEKDPTVLHIERGGAPAGAQHPVVMCHPRTGAPILSVSEMMTKEILGISAERSEQLLAAIFELMYRPENLFEQQWQLHDFVIWDNFGAQHGRPNVTAGGNARTLRKVNAGGAAMAFKPTYAPADARM